MTDDNQKIISYGSYTGSGTKNFDITGLEIHSIIKDSENASIGNNASLSISFHIPDSSGIGSGESNYNTSKESSLKISSKMTNISENNTTSDMNIKLVHNNSLVNVFDISPGKYNETNNTSITLFNHNASDADGDRKSKVIFKGKRVDGTLDELGEISVSHSGTGNDAKGAITFMVNDGNDTSNSLQTVMKLGPKTEYGSGTAQGSGNSTITLSTSSSVVNDYYNTRYIQITGGTGSGQTQRITDYDGTSKVATIDTSWSTNPDNTSTYYIYEAAVTIYGDLVVNNTVKSSNTTISDTLIKLGDGLTETPSKDLGIIFTRGNGTDTNKQNLGLIWDESAKTFALIGCNTEDGSTSGSVTVTSYQPLKLSELTIGNIEADVGEKSILILRNKEGTRNNSVTISSNLGGVLINAHTCKVVDITGGKINIDSKDNAANAISLTTNQGTSETIVITNTQGTSANAILINAVAGGIDMNSTTLDIDAIGLVSIDSSGGRIDIATDNVDQAVNIATGGTRTLQIGVSNGTDTTTLNLRGNMTIGGGTLGSIDMNSTTLDICASGLVSINTTSNIELTSSATILVTSDTTIFTSSTSEKPVVQIKNTTNDATSAHLQFINNRGAGNDGVDSDVCGIIEFYSNDDGIPTNQRFGEIKVVASDVTSGSEKGTITFGVACSDTGAIDNVLTIAGGSSAKDSITTIAGNLNIEGELKNSSGVFSFDDNILVTRSNIWGSNIKSSHINSNTWVQLGNDIDGEAANDESGSSIKISANGKVIIIGAPKNDGANGLDSGHARVYKLNESTHDWVQLGGDIDGATTLDQNGKAVSINADGTIIAVGSENANTNTSNTKVYTYTSSNNSWTLRGSAINTGYYLDLSATGNTIAVGSRYADSGANTNIGSTIIYDWTSSNSSWTQRGSAIYGEAAEDQSGSLISLSADGNIIAIGAQYNDGASGSNTGHVIIYKWHSPSSSWVQLGSDIDGIAINDRSGGYGLSLCADGKVVAIGAIFNDTNKGHVRVFGWNEYSSSWTQRGSDLDGTSEQDRFGYSVSLSADGNILSACASDPDGFGYTKIFRWDGIGAWTQIGSNIISEASADNVVSTSLSADGRIVSIGSKNNSSSAGHVRIYTLGDFINDLSVGGQISYSNVNNASLTVDAVSGTNTAGKNLTIAAGQGTGTGAGGSIIFQVADAGASGSNVNTVATAMTIAGNGAISLNAFANKNITFGTSGTGISNISGVGIYSADTSSIYVGHTRKLSNIDGGNYNNIGVGKNSLNSLTTGFNNVAIGYNSGNTITTGNNNTILGYNSGNIIATGSNNTILGSGAQASSFIATNEITLGNGDVTILRCATSTIATVSDRRDKTDIVDSEYGLEFIEKLRPRTFKWNRREITPGDKNHTKNGKSELGFIAQEFQEAMDEGDNELLGLVYESNPERLEIKPGNLIPILVKSIQDLSNKLLDVTTELKNVKDELNELKQQKL